MSNEAITQAFAELDELVGAEPGRVIQPAEWDSLDPAVLAIIPCWYREVLSWCRLGGVGLEVDTESVRLSELGVTTPEMLSGTLDELRGAFYYFDALLDSPYFPIAWNADGEVFVAERGGGLVGKFEPTFTPGRLEPTYAGTQTLVAGIATVPRWSSVAEFVADLIPEGWEG